MGDKSDVAGTAVAVTLVAVLVWVVASQFSQPSLACTTVLAQDDRDTVYAPHGGLFPSLPQRGKYTRGAQAPPDQFENLNMPIWLAKQKGLVGSEKMDMHWYAGPAPADKVRDRSKFSSLRSVEAKRKEYRARAGQVTPGELMPAIMRGDREAMTNAERKYHWVKGFGDATERLVKGKNYVDFASFDFQGYKNPPRKNMNIDIRGAPRVKIHPELSLWMNRPDVLNQDADLSSEVLSGGSTRNSAMWRRKQEEIESLKSALRGSGRVH